MLDTLVAVAMTVGAVTSQPIGHYEFCGRAPAECQGTLDTGPARMTRQMWLELNAVNKAVNETIHPMMDFDQHGVVEFWQYPKTVGDCEDYALEKRRRLADSFGLSNLLLTVVRQDNGEGHAVLTVRTTEGDLILDNLRKDIINWTQTGYDYLKRQDTRHAGRWVSIGSPRLLVETR